MLRKIFLGIIVVVLLGYMLFSVSFLKNKADNTIFCHATQINIITFEDAPYFQEEDISQLISDAGLDPINKTFSEINMGAIESILEQDILIKDAECYKMTNGTIAIDVYQRVPLVRVMSNTENYYIDTEGQKMPVPTGFAAHVLFASGYIEEEFAQNELYDFVQFLNRSEYWNNNIEQIYISKSQNVELTPKKGDFQIVLGKMEDYEEKFRKLEVFYPQLLDSIGWNRYASINLNYRDQIVCTRR